MREAEQAYVLVPMLKRRRPTGLAAPQNSVPNRESAYGAPDVPNALPASTTLDAPACRVLVSGVEAASQSMMDTSGSSSLTWDQSMATERVGWAVGALMTQVESLSASGETLYGMKLSGSAAGTVGLPSRCKALFLRASHLVAASC